MDSLDLKPHHLDAIFDSGNAYSRMDARRHVEAMYSPEFAEDLEQFIRDEITPNTKVTIVSSNIDDLCKTCKCPYLELCKAGEYRIVFKRMLDNLPSFPSPVVVNALRSILSDGEDVIPMREVKYAKKYGLEFGKSYVWKEIHITDSGTAVQA